MGGQLSRAATRAKPAFPSTPLVSKPPTAPGPVVSEMERNRSITEMLNKATISSQGQQTSGSLGGQSNAAAVGDTATVKNLGLSDADFQQLLVLYARHPEQWDVRALCQKYDLSASSEAAVASALEYVVPFSVESDSTEPDMRPRAVPIEPAPK